MKRRAERLFKLLTVRCHRLASDRQAKVLTVGFVVYLECEDSADATAFQASSRGAATSETYSYGGIVTALFPLNLISSVVGGLLSSEPTLIEPYASRETVWLPSRRRGLG